MPTDKFPFTFSFLQASLPATNQKDVPGTQKLLNLIVKTRFFYFQMAAFELLFDKASF